MGDPRRFDALAELVQRNFPPSRFPAVADVAGGKGHLAGALVGRGYRATIIDSRRQRKHPRGCTRLSGHFLPGMARHYDLLIGLHPDGATEALADAARRRPVVLVPCCLHDWSGPERGAIEDRVRARWRRMGVTWTETLLPIRGKGLVLITGARRSGGTP